MYINQEAALARRCSACFDIFDPQFVLPAALQPRRQGRTEKLLQGASRERKIVRRPTHGYTI